jgi:dTDP-4-dehydrorhamnose 3,5-epimerase
LNHWSNESYNAWAMKILNVKSLAIPEVKVIRFARFADERGYFTEVYRRSDFRQLADVPGFQEVDFVQSNESCSRPGVVRGLHFQWNPFQGKLIRTVAGHMVDLALDIRKGSPTFGKIIAYDMPAAPGDEWGEWIWLPPGMAHGNYFPAATQIEYFCTGQWNPAGEAGICPFAADLDWSLCSAELKAGLDRLARSAIISPKDRDGLTLSAWSRDPRSGNFLFGRC